MQPSVPLNDADALTTTVSAAVAAISDGVRSIIIHIPFNISTSLSPEQISKDQTEDKATAKIINTLRTAREKPKKLKRYTLLNGYLLARQSKGSSELKIMLPLYSGLIMLCIAHLQSHSGLNGLLAIFNRFYDMRNKHHAAALIIASCKGCALTKTINDPKHEYRQGRLKHGT